MNSEDKNGDVQKALVASESLSDEEDVLDDTGQEKGVSCKGVLSKWTNYIHGWQPRFFLLQDGTLAYYKSEIESGFGCRGAVTVEKAVIQTHDFDDCRFEVIVNDHHWYLRAENPEERHLWIDSLETYKADSGYGSQNDLRRHGSLASLTSTRSLASTSSFKGTRGLREKVAELETFRDIVCRQIDSLQGYFDLSAAATPTHTPAATTPTPSTQQAADHDRTLEKEDIEAELESINRFAEERSSLNNIYPTTTQPHPSCLLKSHRRTQSADVTKEMKQALSSGKLGLDLRGEALTFKATTAGIISTLQHCIELMQQREENWKKRLEKETEKRRKCEEQYKTCLAENKKIQTSNKFYAGPDCEEGPNSALNEEEWHDAVDAALDREDLEDSRITRLLSRETPSIKDSRLYQRLTINPKNSLFKEIDQITIEQLTYAQAGVEEGVWELFAEEGEMKM